MNAASSQISNEGASNDQNHCPRLLALAQLYLRESRNYALSSVPGVEWDPVHGVFHAHSMIPAGAPFVQVEIAPGAGDLDPPWVEMFFTQAKMPRALAGPSLMVSEHVTPGFGLDMDPWHWASGIGPVAPLLESEGAVPRFRLRDMQRNDRTVP